MATSREFASIKDVGYRTATSLDTVSSGARFVLDKYPVFPEQVPDELKSALYDGFKIRYAEQNPPTFYTVGDTGTLVKVETKSKTPEGAIKLDVFIAFSYSQQEFGRMKATDPQRYGLIQEIRKDFSKDAHGYMKSLKSAANVILNAGKTSTRAATMAFIDAVKESIAALEKRCKVATARGNDPTADTAKFSAAVVAFWSVYK